jgi:uncharacterized protein YecE (DUF72 family)
MSGVIRTGIGGWVFAPWRGVFYPPGLRQADELQYASRKLEVTEINGTFHGFQKPETFAKWAAQTPEDFIFAAKAHRTCTYTRTLAGNGEAVKRFLNQGISALGHRLGPILWQFTFTRFQPDDFEAFLGMLPSELDGLTLRHAVEVRHESFQDPRFVELCRARGVAIALIDHPEVTPIDEKTADFSYVRLIRGEDENEACYPADQLDAWADRLLAMAADGRDVFAFFINAGKVRAPAGAMALAERVTAKA